MKTNFSISCDDQEDVVKTLLALKALGYNTPYLEDALKFKGFDYDYVAVGVNNKFDLIRLQDDELEDVHFNTFKDFLNWMNPKESEQQKKIRELEETINQAKVQIEELKKETN